MFETGRWRAAHCRLLGTYALPVALEHVASEKLFDTVLQLARIYFLSTTPKLPNRDQAMIELQAAIDRFADNYIELFGPSVQTPKMHEMVDHLVPDQLQYEDWIHSSTYWLEADNKDLTAGIYGFTSPHTQAARSIMLKKHDKSYTLDKAKRTAESKGAVSSRFFTLNAQTRPAGVGRLVRLTCADLRVDSSSAVCFKRLCVDGEAYTSLMGVPHGASSFVDDRAISFFESETRAVAFGYTVAFFAVSEINYVIVQKFEVIAEPAFPGLPYMRRALKPKGAVDGHALVVIRFSDVRSKVAVLPNAKNELIIAEIVSTYAFS